MERGGVNNKWPAILELYKCTANMQDGTSARAHVSGRWLGEKYQKAGMNILAGPT